MKKVLAILELFVLLFILYAFTWARFDGRLSSPFHLEATPTRIVLNIIISLIILARAVQILKFLRTGFYVAWKTQMIVLGLLVLAISSDIYTFFLWNVYAKQFYYATLVLISPFSLFSLSYFLKNKLT